MVKARTGAKPRPKPRAAAPPRKSRAVKSVALSSGNKVALDGDLVFLIDALYHDFAARLGFAPAYAEVQKEIARVLGQMDAAATREYFAASLFLNYVTYENEMAERVAERIAAKAKRFSR